MGKRAGISIGLLGLVAMLITISIPQPAHACSCGTGLPADLLSNSDIAFVGVVVDQQSSFGEESVESLITVSQVVKGHVEASIIVDAPTDDECGQMLTVESAIGVTAVAVSGEVLPSVCSVMEPEQLLAAADELGLEVTNPVVEELQTALPESTSNYAAAIPLSIILSLVFLAAVAIGTRTTVDADH